MAARWSRCSSRRRAGRDAEGLVRRRVGQQNIFTFAFQMVLILVTGYTLAEAPVLKRAIVAAAGRPKNQVQGALPASP